MQDSESNSLPSELFRPPNSTYIQQGERERGEGGWLGVGVGVTRPVLHEEKSSDKREAARVNVDMSNLDAGRMLIMAESGISTAKKKKPSRKYVEDRGSIR